ncbi:MAG TPA: hypothetical protein VGK99_22850 [Acidobacteriota bacterium]|jgi:hypothetical protein
MNALGKVIVRTCQGTVVSGFSREDKIKDCVKVITRDGKEEIFTPEDLKAIFFVKDFQGDPKYEEVDFLTKQPISEKLWVRVVFFDGETLEGAVKNDGELLNSLGLYLRLSDHDANNELAYIPKSAIKALTILGTE